MKIFSQEQIREWDAHTIREQEISSIELMERAAYACFKWLVKYGFTQKHIHIFCGKGNNGGDGLALARILTDNNVNTSVYILETGKAGTRDFQENLQRLHRVTSHIYFIQSNFVHPTFTGNDLVIDALFGTGLNKPLKDTALELVHFLNKNAYNIISIDMPSGLFTDQSTKGHKAISATHTLSFQNIKLAFLIPENKKHIGYLHLLDIGLSPYFEDAEPATHELVAKELVRDIIKPRYLFSHKGNFGHVALVAGSYGMMGAATLAVKACLHSGVGKLTAHIPSCGYAIIQLAAPEAMCRVSGENQVTHFEINNAYTAIGVGPGMGISENSAGLIESIFKNKVPLVLDADALNTLASEKKILSQMPAGTVITPHPKEFERMFGTAANDFERLNMAVTKAAELNIYIVLKGHYTAIVTPMKKVYFNNTGNAGMAKAGMGDALTGIITGLLAQRYPLPEAAILGVWLHGLAGDIAAEKYSQQAMQAGDLIQCLSEAWKLVAR